MDFLNSKGSQLLPAIHGHSGHQPIANDQIIDMHLIQIGVIVTIAAGPPVRAFRNMTTVLEHCSKEFELGRGTAPAVHVVERYRVLPLDTSWPLR